MKRGYVIRGYGGHYYTRTKRRDTDINKAKLWKESTKLGWIIKRMLEKDELFLVEQDTDGHWKKIKREDVNYEN